MGAVVSFLEPLESSTLNRTVTANGTPETVSGRVVRYPEWACGEMKSSHGLASFCPEAKLKQASGSHDEIETTAAGSVEARGSHCYRVLVSRNDRVLPYICMGQFSYIGTFSVSLITRDLNAHDLPPKTKACCCGPVKHLFSGGYSRRYCPKARFEVN